MPNMIIKIDNEENDDWIKFRSREQELRIHDEIARELSQHKTTVKEFAQNIINKLKGGPGSGNFGHAGRPGKVGGSASSNFGWGKARALVAAPLKTTHVADFNKTFKNVKEFMALYEGDINSIKQAQSDSDKKVREINKEMRAEYKKDYPDWKRISSLRGDLKRAKLEKKENEKKIEKLNEEMRQRFNAPGITAPKFDDAFSAQMQGIYGSRNKSGVIEDFKESIKEVTESGIFGEHVTGGKLIVIQATDNASDAGCFRQKDSVIEQSPEQISKLGTGWASLTLYHEMGHWIEVNAPQAAKIKKRLEKFFVDRVKNQKPKFEYNMVLKPDAFITPYVGRLYRSADPVFMIDLPNGRKMGFSPEEVLSTGIEFMVTKPAYFMMKDPEHFALTVSIMMGVPE